MMSKRELIIVGGANGSGKTTFALKCAALLDYPYLGADAIAAELSPGNPERAAVTAGKEFVRRVARAIDEKQSIIAESTLSGRSFHALSSSARCRFQYFNRLCVPRFGRHLRETGGGAGAERWACSTGRRYPPEVLRSLANFWQLYRPLADNWTLWYNSGVEFVDVATGSASGERIREAELYSTFRTLVRMAGNG